jgi:hypothetical protein
MGKYLVVLLSKMLSNIIWGLIGMTIAFALIKWRKQIIDFTGSWGWAERYLGAGGSYTAIVIVAVLIFLVALTKLVGKLDDIFGATTGRFF